MTKEINGYHIQYDELQAIKGLYFVSICDNKNIIYYNENLQKEEAIELFGALCITCKYAKIK
jgi:hypothetical protein